MRGAFKSKTMYFSLALAVLGALEMNASLLRDLIGPENFGAVMIGIGVVSAALRVVTTQALSEK